MVGTPHTAPGARQLAAAWLALLALAAGAACTVRAAQPATAPATASAPASTSAPATRLAPAIQADALLKTFPANANPIAARSDARNFSVEGRVREVRTVTLDAAGAVTTAPGAKSEVRLYLVGRAQADDAPAHFTCRMDQASEEAAGQIKPDQIVRLTGSIGKVAGPEDRIELLNCHDLQVTGELNVGDQLVGTWRSTDLAVDGTQLRKAMIAKGQKADDIPEGDYSPPWHLEVSVKADNTLTAELLDKEGQSLKKVTGRYQELADTPEEVRLRMQVTGMGPQEVAASLENGHLKMSLPGFADRFLLPNTHFKKLDGTPLAMDTKAVRDQTVRWFQANIAPNAPNTIAPYISTSIDNAYKANQGFIINVGSAALRRARTTTLIGAYGKLTVLEYSEAETAVNASQKSSLSAGVVQYWGTVMTPEVRLENLTVDNRAAFDPAKPLTGKVTLRSLRRTFDTQYMLLATSNVGMGSFVLEKPSPDAQVISFHFDAPPAVGPGPTNPRIVLFFVGRNARPDDLFNNTGGRIISEPIPVLVDMVQPK
jgi:hypothetical protein